MPKNNTHAKLYILLIRDPDTGKNEMLTVNADSLGAAKLTIPEGWVLVEYARVDSGRTSSARKTERPKKPYSKYRYS